MFEIPDDKIDNFTVVNKRSKTCSYLADILIICCKFINNFSNHGDCYANKSKTIFK